MPRLSDKHFRRRCFYLNTQVVDKISPRGLVPALQARRPEAAKELIEVRRHGVHVTVQGWG